MDDLVAVLSPHRNNRRFLRIRARKVDYKELLKSSELPEQQCTHTTQILDASKCSQCQNVRVERVRSTIVPEPIEE